MEDEFDLYGDADIYASGDGAKEDEGKADFQPGAATKQADASGDGAAGNKRSRDDEMSSDFKPQQGIAGPSSQTASQSSAHDDAMRGVSSQQHATRPLDEPIDPASARVALAGRPKVTDPNVQNALYVGELDWWISDEDIRRIANDIGIPIQITDVTFSEHKVNGKSKGVCFVETASEDEANQLRNWFENNDVNFKRASVNLATSANGNPFKTLPKDPPPREARAPRGTMRGAMAMGARESGRGGGQAGHANAQQNFPMAGAPIRMGGSNGGPPSGMPMMNPMMMGMMGGGGAGGGGRGGFNNPMAFMGGGGRGGNNAGWGGRGRGQGHFNPNFFGGGGGGGGGGTGPGGRGGGGGGGNDDRERKRYRQDEGGY